MKRYSLLQKFFHKIVLKNKQLLDITFDIEKFFALKNSKINNSKKLFEAYIQKNVLKKDD